MQSHLELIHTEGNSPHFNMPYTPAIKVRRGSQVYLAGVTAAPIYHSHPHIPEEFADIPGEAQAQAEMCMENLQTVLTAAGATLADVVDLTRYVVDLDRNQDAINQVMGRYLGEHRPATTTVEVVRLATDPKLVLELRAVAVALE
jgi:enamine deaminase RidA (YjgF/YER057c/UK114 family)